MDFIMSTETMRSPILRRGKYWTLFIDPTCYYISKNWGSGAVRNIMKNDGPQVTRTYSSCGRSKPYCVRPR